MSNSHGTAGWLSTRGLVWWTACHRWRQECLCWLVWSGEQTFLIFLFRRYQVKNMIGCNVHLLIFSSERRAPSLCCSCAGTFLCLAPDSTKHNPASVSLSSNVYVNARSEKGLTIRWPLITSRRSSSLEPSRKSWNRSTTIHGGLRCHSTHRHFNSWAYVYYTARTHRPSQRHRTWTNNQEEGWKTFSSA